MKDQASGPNVSEAAVLRKVALRLLPYLFLLYVINILDRTNIGIAKLKMLDDLKLDETAYGLGAGIFYVGYILFEAPSNLILARTGARRWIARIMVSWGVVSSCMMFVTGPWSFYALRVLLGVAEAGFFPGIILYMSQWFPSRNRASAMAAFMTGGVLSAVIGNPISGFILHFMDQVAGLTGWQWVFLIEGVPAVVLGVVTYFFLTDGPEQAAWLRPAERAWLVRRLDAERDQGSHRGTHTLVAALRDPRVWLLIGVYFTVAMGDNSFGFYLPSFLRAGFPAASEFEIGLLAVLPNLAAVVGMVLISRYSDSTGERRWYVAGPAFLAGLGWLLIGHAPPPWLLLVCLALTVTGMKSMLPTFWTLPTTFLRGTGAAGGIALINSVANVGGILGPYIIGRLKDATGGFGAGQVVMAVTLFGGGLLVLGARSASVRADS